MTLGVCRLSVGSFALELLGPFRLLGQDGQRIDISSKKAQALVAMLAVSSGGERTRSWLQGQLWGSRAQDQAQASLRSELSALRNTLKGGDAPLIQSDKNRVWLDLSQLTVDARNRQGAGPPKGAFLEGLDIPGEDSFEEWLREERRRFAVGAGADIATEKSIAPPPPNAFASLPALTILPFANLTGDPAQDFLAEGISEDLIDHLSRLRWLPIIARGSSFAFRSANQDPKEAGKALGARYVLEGRLRKFGVQQILTTALVNSESGQQLWSAKVNISDDSAPNVLENLLTGIASTLGARIDQEEQSRAQQKPQSDLNVRDLIWRGRWHLNRMTKTDAALAKSCFAAALAKEPNSPEALIQSTWANLWEIWATRRSDDETRAIRLQAQRAIIADMDDARGHMLAGIAEIWLRQPVRAEALLRHAIALNPSLSLAYAELGSVLYLKGEPEEAIHELHHALRLSPNDNTNFYTLGELAMAHLMIQDFATAVEFADKAIMRRTAFWYGHVIKINALVRGGAAREAKSAFADLEASKSQFERAYIDWLPFLDSKWNDFLKEGLNLACG